MTRLATFWQQLRSDTGVALQAENGQPVVSVQISSSRWCAIFRYSRLRFSPIGEAHETEAQTEKACDEYLMRLLEHRLPTLPWGLDSVNLLRRGGKPPDEILEYSLEERSVPVLPV
jgi:hypothetical protein